MVNLSNRRAIAERQLGRVDWENDTIGFVLCPGASRHTTPTSRRATQLFLDRIPGIHCVHTSCAQEVAIANRKLRSEIGKTEGRGPQSGDPAARRQFAEKSKLHRQQAAIQVAATLSRESILTDYNWPPSDIWESSPVRLTDDPANDWRHLLGIFPPDDVVWIGNTYDSGPGFERHFRTARSWLTEGSAPGPFVSPSTFASGTNSRSNANVHARPFLVVESDVLPKDAIGAVFQWCRLFMRLRAVVDTGGKSLHGWFRFPSDPTVFEQLKTILPALGCDSALFKPSQPVRLPGYPRDDKVQSLLYLDYDDCPRYTPSAG